jgi:nucleotide-binding universal stress UspA family protein
MKIQHVLVATDLSDASFRACAPVQEFAQAQGARLTLLHVVHSLSVTPHGAPLAPAVPPPDLDKHVEEARKALAGQIELQGWSKDTALEVEVGDDIADAVRDYVAAHDVDLVAVSTHGRTGFRHLVLGSVAESILRHSQVPVLVFPNPVA